MLLIDNLLSTLVGQGLRDAGHNAAHGRDRDLQAAEDSLVRDQATSEDRVPASADMDFGPLLALRLEPEAGQCQDQ
jgi:predicted nuclease of predicted toxin-antitoxin system